MDGVVLQNQEAAEVSDFSSAQTMRSGAVLFAEPMKTRPQGARKNTLDVMFTLHNKILKQAGGLFMPLCLAAAFCAGAAMDAHAQPAPPNDNLANAQVIFGAAGTDHRHQCERDNGKRPGEPAPYGAGGLDLVCLDRPHYDHDGFQHSCSIDLTKPTQIRSRSRHRSGCLHSQIRHQCGGYEFDTGGDQ